jgi:hypothetical protein
MKNDKYIYAGLATWLLYVVIFMKIHNDYSIKVLLPLIIPSFFMQYIEDKTVKQILRYAIVLLLVIQFILNVKFDYYKI